MTSNTTIRFTYVRILYFNFILLFYASSVFSASRIYVNQNSSAGNNDGSSWTNAYLNLQDALDAAVVNDSIWVAMGTYIPTESPNGSTSDTKDRAFHWDKDLAIYGGFIGDETALSQRDWKFNKTILSGALGGVNTNRSYHVAITARLTRASILDGFSVLLGQANGSGTILYSSLSFDKISGGGMYNNESSPTLTNMIFTQNTAELGGGILNRRSSPFIAYATFITNTAVLDGLGGGLYNFDNSSPIVANSLFINNHAGIGGGMNNALGANPIISNTTFFVNTATSRGGGIDNLQSDPVITNCIFSENRENGSVAIDGADINVLGSTPIVTYSLTQSFIGGSGSLSTLAAMFENTSDLIGPDNTWGTLDDGLQLTRCSPARNGGTNSGIQGGILVDMVDSIRIRETGVDMGPYEYDPEGKVFEVYYVSTAGNNANDGTTWATAFGELQFALDEACTRDTIWVMNGVYTPTESPDGSTTNVRDRAFHWNKDLVVYGGFNGTEVSLEQRDLDANQTILSGNLGVENSHHVVVIANLNARSIFDGFIIQDGIADGILSLTYSGHLYIRRLGGGMYVRNSYLQFANLALLNNTAGEGGGLYLETPQNIEFNVNLDHMVFNGNHAVSGGGAHINSTNTTISHSSFINNNVSTQFGTADGGGIYIENSSSSISNCNFNGNTATGQTARGGGLSISSFNFWQDSVSLYDVIIDSNSAKNGGGISNIAMNLLIEASELSNNNAEAGGAIYSNQSNNSIVNNSDIHDNTANNGAGIYLEAGTIHLLDVILRQNIAGFNGGGLYSTSNANPQITATTFLENEALNGGGAFSNSSSMTIIDSRFDANSAMKDGGGIYGAQSANTIRKSEFNSNTAINYGGGMYSFSSTDSITQSNFRNNSADFGAGMYSNESNTSLSSLLMEHNMATDGGGGIFNNNAISKLSNIVFSANSADNGGGIFNLESQFNMINSTLIENNSNINGGALLNTLSTPVVSNSIFWNNLRAGNRMVLGADIFDFLSTTDITYSSLQQFIGGDGSIKGNPLFIDSSNPDGPDEMWLTADDGLQLKSCSQAIDAGINDSIPNDLLTDIVDSMRIQNSLVDMGAYESDPSTITDEVPVVYVDHAASGSSSGLSWMDASVDLQSALRMSAGCSVDSIKIAEGTYFPTSTSDRSISFEIEPLDHTVIIGGYPNGGGLHDLNNHEVVLSGNIAGSSDLDNSYRVVDIKGQVELNNLAIKDGYGNETISPLDRGTGIYVSSTGDALLDHVTIENNSSAGIGSGIFMEAGAKLNIINSIIYNNPSLLMMSIFDMELGAELVIDSETIIE